VIRVLVAEDMRILRDTLAALLRLEDDIEVVADVCDGESIVPAVLAQHPHAGAMVRRVVTVNGGLDGLGYAGCMARPV
jgi:two-component system response regulator DesR